MDLNNYFRIILYGLEIFVINITSMKENILHESYKSNELTLPNITSLKFDIYYFINNTEPKSFLNIS